MIKTQHRYFSPWNPHRRMQIPCKVETKNHCCRCTRLGKKSLESIPRFQRRKYIDFEELPEKALLAGPLAVLCAGFFAIDQRPPGMNRCVLRSSSKDRRDRAPPRYPFCQRGRCLQATRNRSAVTRFGDVEESPVAVEKANCSVLLIAGSVPRSGNLVFSLTPKIQEIW